MEISYSKFFSIMIQKKSKLIEKIEAMMNVDEIRSLQADANKEIEIGTRDVINNKWYAFSEEDYYTLEELETISDWIKVSNTVV